ncbi:DUF2497 domain-containing protein [Henriciella sp.]|uniref:DUF2497 domain-containing protein n=1 Tax=Henriciella sp. TaxID=1968823 RepID=UPI0026280843|nr:DUF2497 domain-containing protein [Henriciella sp.]
MAEKAQSEPTMEEILASIRKIISDEGDSPRAAAPKKEEPAVSVNVSDDDDFEDLSLDDVIEQTGGSAEALGQDSDDNIDPIGINESSDELLTDVDESMFEDLAMEEATQTSEVEGTADEELEDFDLDVVNLENEEPVLATESHEKSFDDPVEDWDSAMNEPEPELTAPAPEPEPVERPVFEDTSMLRGKMESTAKHEAEGLTDERIAGAAASALGKLMVKQSADEGNPNTLDGLMKELLRPMIKEWLDANLPAIVERKVEEEVQRIARMAR